MKTDSSLQLSELIDKNEFDRAFVLGKKILQESPDARAWESLLKLYVLKGEEDNRILPFLKSSIKKVSATTLESFLPQLCFQIRSSISIQLYRETRALIELWAEISEILGDGKLTERLKGYLDYLSGVESIRRHDLEKAQSSLMSSHSHFLKFGLEAEVKVSRILSSSIRSLNIIINITNYGGLKEVRDVLKNQLSEIEKNFGRPPYFFDVREIEDRHDCFDPENELMQFIWDYIDNVSAALELRKGVFKLSGFEGWKDRLKGEKLNVWIPYLDALEGFLREFDKSIVMTGHMDIDTIQLKEQKRLLRFLKPKDVLVADMGDLASNVNITTQAVERISRILERFEEKEASIKKAKPVRKDQKSRNARVWTIKIPGDQISKSKINQIIKELKNKNGLVVEKTGDFFKMFSGKEEQSSPPYKYFFPIIEHTLKNQGVAGDIYELLSVTCNDKSVLQKLKDLKEMRSKVKRLRFSTDNEAWEQAESSTLYLENKLSSLADNLRSDISRSVNFYLKPLKTRITAPVKGSRSIRERAVYKLDPLISFVFVEY